MSCVDVRDFALRSPPVRQDSPIVAVPYVKRGEGGVSFGCNEPDGIGCTSPGKQSLGEPCQRNGESTSYGIVPHRRFERGTLRRSRLFLDFRWTQGLFLEGFAVEKCPLMSPLRV